MDYFLQTFLPTLAVTVALLILIVLQVVCMAIAYYDLFASCEPENKALYLVLGLVFSITLPIFLFICRKKDLGMPARKVVQPTPEVAPEPVVIPVAETPAEPWTNPEE